MKIGILSLPLHTNYGGILQALALQTVLERMGHEVKVFDNPLEKYQIPISKKIFIYLKRCANRYIRGIKSVLIDQEQFIYERDTLERQYTQPFIDKNIHRYLIWHLSDIRKEDFEAIVVGSDQVWRMLYFKGFWRTNNTADAFLEFTEEWSIKRISYAASFGTYNPEIPNNQMDACIKAISKFNGISVREESGVELCEKYMHVKAHWVVDPTMLLCDMDYIKIAHLENVRANKGILMSYILDENNEILELRKRIARDKGLKIKITNLSDTGTSQRGKKPQPPLQDWLRAFLEADYVINDSFHACVFSIIFHKQFTVIGNRQRGLARFESLLKMFGLEDRLIVTPSDYTSLPDIDFTKVDKILNEKRAEAISFLKNALV